MFRKQPAGPAAQEPKEGPAVDDQPAVDNRSIPSPSLHACMVGLVLANLVFVQLTEAASPAWLAPLYILTLLSSLLARFKERFVYRAFWNLVVLGFFTVLVRHALSADLAYVLQDGLVLAALCQVHLLNNLNKDQPPDLLFLNSYLIAIITGYITVDLGFAGAFLAYVPFYVLGLQFLSVYRPSARLSRREARTIAFDGFKRSAVLLGLALLVFVFWPRDFQREALLSKYFEFSPNDAQAKVDFSESLDLKQQGAGGEDQGRLVMTISPTGAPILGMPSLWRGTTLGKHRRDGSWARLEGADLLAETGDLPWRDGDLGESVVRDQDPDAVPQIVRVDRKGGSTQVAFMPYDSQLILLDAVHTRGHLDTDTDGTVRYSNPGGLRYELAIAEPASIEPGSLPDASQFLGLEPSIHTRTAADLAGKLRDRVGRDASEGEVARRFSEYLRDRYPYRLPGDSDEEPSDSLHAFLTTEKGGHCEFFASALATMLRSEGIPSRVVTGFRIGEQDKQTGTWSVRSTSAHAWVEARVDGAWRTFDPTPAADLGAVGEGFIDRANAALIALWTRITSFDASSRALLTEWMKAAPGRFVAVARANPAASAGVCGLLALMIVQLGKRRRSRTPETVRNLRTAFRHAEVTPEPGETPRETLERVESIFAITIDDLDGLRSAVEAHEASRYRMN